MPVPVRGLVRIPCVVMRCLPPIYHLCSSERRYVRNGVEGDTEEYRPYYSGNMVRVVGVVDCRNDSPAALVSRGETWTNVAGTTGKRFQDQSSVTDSYWSPSNNPVMGI
jgi:hypothetical protein